jgi:hypothetical protein
MSEFKERDLVVINAANSVHHTLKGIVCLVRKNLYTDYFVVSRSKVLSFGYFKSHELILDTEAIAEQHGATLSQPTVDNVPIKNVGLQTHIEARFDYVHPVVLKLLAECLGFGAKKYGNTNYRKISVQQHLNHAMNHINEHNRGDVDELHLVNALARIHFAISCLYETGHYTNAYWHPDTLSIVAPKDEVK